MARKTAALVVLASFSLFQIACVPVGTGGASRRAVAPHELGRSADKAKIVHVVLKSGKTIPFPPKQPGRVAPEGDAVVGVANHVREFAEAEIERVSRNEKGRVLEIETRDGAVYEVLSATASEGPTQYHVRGPLRIPFADIHQVWLKRSSALGTVGLVVGMVCVAGAVALAMSTSRPDPDWDDSCPFVYSWTGEEYVLDAEPYGAALSEGLKRTDWVEMTHLRAVDGEYRVLLANELKETEHTDELKLVAVDHAPGWKVAPDVAGRFHAFPDPRPPSAAVDLKTGRDILPFVGANDPAFWTSDLEGRDPDGEGEFRDELVFEFPKPAGAKTAKLLANVWTSAWGSRAPGMFLEHYGTSLAATYAEVDAHGPFYAKYMAWAAAEELAVLKVWVETPGGWQARSLLMGGAPVVAKDKAYTLAVGDVPGEVLRIKLRPPVHFWMVNSLAVDYDGEPALEITEIAADKAVDHAGRDAREVLASTDGVYLVSPNPGQRTELVFTAPPLRAGLERTVFVKASGFYRVHVDAAGEPRTELARRVLSEPGFAARYAFREYLKWEAGVRAAAPNRSAVRSAKRTGQNTAASF